MVIVLTIVNITLLCVTLLYFLSIEYIPPLYRSYAYDAGMLVYMKNIVGVCIQAVCIVIKESFERDRELCSQKILDYII